MWCHNIKEGGEELKPVTGWVTPEKGQRRKKSRFLVRMVRMVRKETEKEDIVRSG